ncbi:CRISPR-associated endonuclease Cas3'' [Methylomarinum vadi]|uniref:CRISPR-associated endonuclease Cas3'' n=1 Tax=Methylomarinum vadi TaxID=438855 RepID=UPI0004DFA07E|nr:CRISPR-associated endonuclease Cas3'' [Methylomarinum vadi]
MMVTFVSECEKKALNRTRRVLDAFANRIGSRTWQTVITEEGLQAVKKLLRKTATKNTAVACHWIRSRSRSELQWIVGNQDKFNVQGIVPVNYTDGELIMDLLPIKIDSIYANTKKQPLDQHLFAVGYLAFEIINRLMDDKNLARAAFIAGCLHDLGKIDPCFQNWLSDEVKKKILPEISEEGMHIQKPVKFSFENHPRHNEISYLLYQLLDDESHKETNKFIKEAAKHVVYWHHAKPFRNSKKEFSNLDVVYQKLKANIGDSKGFQMLTDTVQPVICSINALADNYFSDDILTIEGILKRANMERIEELDKQQFPQYKRYSEKDKINDYRKFIIENAKTDLCRAAVISADRQVSSINADSLIRLIEERSLDELLDDALLKDGNLSAHIQDCLNAFEHSFPNSERNQQQSLTARRLKDVEGVAVLNGPAGCGKTKIALEWALNSRVKKILWICPRVQVCEGLYREFTDSASDYHLAACIEINTGEFKTLYQNGREVQTPDDQEFSGDIVITTIDQILNTITTHRKVTGLVQYMNAHVVFDEYHEYITMPAFNLLFAELVACKQLQENRANTLLVSATPNYHFVENLLNVHRDDIIGIQSFNPSQYQITFQAFAEKNQDDSNPLYQPQPENTIVISNTATTAQLSFIKNQKTENEVLFHAKYKKADKQIIFDSVFDAFKRNGSRKYDVLRSSPVVQASLNITCQHMVTEFTHAENWLQRFGRLDRFGENSDVNQFIVAIPDSLAIGGKQTSRCARFLNSMSCLQSAKAWNEFLQNRLDGQPVTINQLYEYYEQFYQDEACIRAIEEDLIKALKESVHKIKNKLIDPISIPIKKAPQESGVKIKKHSLRGDNRFVQMAVCEVEDLDRFQFSSDYAYDPEELDANLTYVVEPILGFGDSQQNLLAFMAKKHHNVMGSKKVYNDNILLNEARSPEKPIYLSYTPSDLQKVGGESQRHSHAIYYAIGKRQVIGAIAITQLQLTEEN